MRKSARLDAGGLRWLLRFDPVTKERRISAPKVIVAGDSAGATQATRPELRSPNRAGAAPEVFGLRPEFKGLGFLLLLALRKAGHRVSVAPPLPNSA